MSYLRKPATDDDLDAFRFSLRYQANGRATEMTEMCVLVIARLRDDAVAIARTKCPQLCSAKLLASGPSVLKEACGRGLKEGEALVL